MKGQIWGVLLSLMITCDNLTSNPVSFLEKGMPRDAKRKERELSPFGKLTIALWVSARFIFIRMSMNDSPFL
jgi:hypothetical protein